MIEIAITNNYCQIFGNAKEANKLYKAFKVRNVNAFFLRKYMPKGWDGKMDFITQKGKFKTGLLQRVIDTCKELGIKFELEDNRTESEELQGVITKRYAELTKDPQRSYQRTALEAIINNKVEGILFPRGAIKAATNAGKTVISAGIHMAYKSKTIFLMNSKELFIDALVEIPKFTGKPVGQISSNKIEWADFMVVMVGTLRNRLKDPVIARQLAGYHVLIVDEADMADNKTNKKVIEFLFNTVVRIGLSGTIFVSKLAKDKPKNYNLEGFFGPEIFDISNRALIDLGVSSEVAVKFVRGNIDDTVDGEPWADEYDRLIIKNKVRNKKVLKRSQYHWKHKRRTQLIIAQRHEHITRLYKLFKKKYPPETRIEWVHHSRKDRFQVTQDFMDGKIDILIGSMILKRGKNFKKMNYMMNAGAGKSVENILQLLGRAFRGCKHYEDMWDEGLHLKRHSRKRATYYRNEKIKVNNKYR